MANDTIQSMSSISRGINQSTQLTEGQVETARDNAHTTVTTQPGERQQSQAAGNPNTQLMFRVDQSTQELTVFIVDRASQQVIRTIPPDAVNKLKAGDLVELFL